MKCRLSSLGQEPKQESEARSHELPIHSIKKGLRDLGLARGLATQRQSRSQWLQTSLCLECQCTNSRQFWLGSLLGGTQLKLLFVVFLFSYFTITSRCLRLCYGIDPVGKTWSDSVSGVNVRLHPSSIVWEWLPEWFLNGWTGKSPNSKIHVYVRIYICIYLYMQDTHTVLHRCYVFYIYKYVCMCIRSFVSILKLNISQSLCDNEKKKGFVQLSKSRCVKQTCNYHLRSNTMSLIGMHKIFGLHYIWTIWYDDHTLSGPS